MPEALSKSQIDKLGERLKSGAPTDEDLILLDRYRRSFAEAYETVFKAASQEISANYLDSPPTGRGAKSTGAIIAKLQRSTVKLSQMQDIAGCRLTSPTIIEQNEIVAILNSVFPKARFKDRRSEPSHGYRAVHLIVKVGGRPVEIQVRSRMQHTWAETCEKLANSDSSIKYGGGHPEIWEFLSKFSESIELTEAYSLTLTGKELTDQNRLELDSQRDRLKEIWLRFALKFYSEIHGLRISFAKK